MVRRTTPSKPQGAPTSSCELSRVVTRRYDAYVAPTGLKNCSILLSSHVVLLGPLRPGELAARMKLDALHADAQPAAAHRRRLGGAGGPVTRAAARWWPPGGRASVPGGSAWKQAQLALNARLGNQQRVALHSLIDDCLTVLDERHRR